MSLGPSMIWDAAMVVMLFAAAGLAVRAAVREQPEGRRGIWLLVAAAELVWALGYLAHAGLRLAEADGDYLWLVLAVTGGAAYLLISIASLRLLAGRSPIDWVLGGLDVVLLALGLGTVWLVAIVYDRFDPGASAGVAAAHALPAAGLTALISVLLAAQGATVVPASWLVLAAALVFGVAGDFAASVFLLNGDGSEHLAFAGWMTRAAALVLAGAVVGPTFAREGRRVRPGLVQFAVILLAFVGALSMATVAFREGHSTIGPIVGGLAVAALISRFLVHSFKRQLDAESLRRALREQEQLAVMDTLTGLYNRRFFDAALKLELDRGERSQDPVGLLVLDLDHFKSVNDSFGHLAGDDILREVARRLLGAVRTGDIVARYGGEEFVVLLPGGRLAQLSEIGDRCRLAVREEPIRVGGGRVVSVTISVGGAIWPDDAGSVRDLFHSADSALYRAKANGRDRVELASGNESAPPLQPVPRRRPEMPVAQPVSGGVDSATMSRWAALVARALGLDGSTQDRCALAARFHDVGKYVVPESILRKPGPLSPLEWDVMRMHPEYGAWLVEFAPGMDGVGDIIRGHHERYDGLGYPVGMSREEIPREAAIVGVCDAWMAMRNGRPYASAKSESEARAELLAARGKQFDPAVVETFLMFDENDVMASGRLEAIVGVARVGA